MTTEYNNVQLEFKPTGKQYKGVEYEKTDETLLICSKKGQWYGYAFKTPAGESIAGFWTLGDQELREGQQYMVVLQLGGMKSTGSRYQDVVSAIPVESGETVSAAVSAPVAKPNSGQRQDTTQQAIGKGQLLNLLTHSFPQDFGLFDGDKDKYQECIKYELMNLAQGLPLDFAYINTVTVNETEDMSIEDAGRLLEQIEKQEPLIEETVGDWTSKCVTIWKERYGDDESSQLQFTQWRTDNVGSRSQYENEIDYWKAIHKKLTGV